MNEEIQDAEVDTQMVPVEQPRALAKPMNRPILTEEAIALETKQRKLLGTFIEQNMVEGIDGDYGVIPGTTKRTLLKPGAEKLIQLFYCTPRYTVTSKVENYETGLFSYHFKCQILNNDGNIVAEGVGFCSTYESKYRYANSNRKCPKCGSEQIIKGKDEFGGGWLCWAKKGGCGAKFPDDAPEIINQSAEQIQNPDIVDKINTVYKIAKKRAVVDAAISLARCSDLFTQDLDDTITQQQKPDDMSPYANGMKPGAKNTSQQRQAQQADVSRGEQVSQSAPPQQSRPQQGQYPENKICPECGAKAVGRSKYPPRGNPEGVKGWFCYKPAGGCGKGFPYEQFPEQPQQKTEDYQYLIDGWTKWAAEVADDDAFNEGFKKSQADIAALHVDVRKPIWAHLQALAKKRGLVYDKGSDRFIPKS